MTLKKYPVFTVIVPIYNKGPYINRAITSILKQSFEDFELIIVLDPCTDNSVSEVKNFKDERISVYYRDEPGPGGYAARNLGIKKSKGKWVVFLDADDEYYPNHLELMYKLSDLYPEVPLLACSKLIEKNGTSDVDLFSKLQSKDNLKMSFYDYLYFSYKFDKPFNTNSVAIHRSLIDSVETIFPEGRAKRSGDIYAWVKLTAAAKDFAWSSHIGSYTYKDVIGVSATNAPSIILFRDLVDEISCRCSKLEQIFLKKYVNKLIRVAYFEQKKITRKVEQPLYKSFYWEVGFWYCFFWCLMSVFPINLFEKIKSFYKSII